MAHEKDLDKRKKQMVEYTRDLIDQIIHTINHYCTINEKKDWWVETDMWNYNRLRIKGSLTSPYVLTLCASENSIKIMFYYSSLELFNVSLIKPDNDSLVTLPHISTITEAVISIMQGISECHKRADHEFQFVKSLLK